MIQTFVRTDEGRTSALQVTSRDTIGEIVRRACGRTVVDEGGWYVQCQGWGAPQEVEEWRMETCCN